ncbi:MAG TPA: tRNA (adenosine(37)-N6)-dimethylallyltransferase MiaA [Candidatus Sulfotelmatobacter sp.]|nr:tRNA (adenosine(37)-N6)-dimethylallyltransferase MiaA [Candidatus Sulfotelmatobacter sp.]
MPEAWPPLLVIAGATATGKTPLSLALADALGGVEIISADSRQVFRGMDIGTAKVAAADRARIPHFGLDLADPDAGFTAADFQRHAYAVLPGIAERGHLALLVGGTGLYLRAVARGVPFDEGSVDARLRAALEARLEQEGLAALAAELRQVAPTIAAHTDLANPRRVVRGLERARLVGDTLPEPPRGYPGPMTWLGLHVGAEIGRQRIVDRAAAQFAAGLVEEAVGLRQRFGTPPRAFSAFGYFAALDLADGRLDLEAALAGTAGRTLAYARRQRTWFRGERGIGWLPAGEDPLPTALGVARRLRDGVAYPVARP